MVRVIRILVLAVFGTLILASVRYRGLVRDQPVAPALTTKDGWLNTDRPLRLSEELKGHVVVLDFWTYCCINCVHVLPDLEYLEEKYKDEPFVVIGVHSAKFRNESERESIRQAIFRNRIRHPVVIDSNFALWNAYDIEGWPSFVVIGADGKLVPIHNQFGTPLFVTAGEGKRSALDAAVAKAIDDARSLGILAAKRVEFQLDAAVPSTTGLAYPGKVSATPMTAVANGYVFIADSSHNRVIVASWPTTTEGVAKSEVRWIIGGIEPGYADGALGAVRLHDPQGLVYDPRSRTLFVADRGNHAVRAIDIGALEKNRPEHAVRTVLGTGKQVNDREAGKSGVEQGVSSPWDLALSADGKLLYIAMAGVHQIWTMDITTGAAAVLAGSGAEDLRDGPAATAALAQPSGLSLTVDGSRLYFADSEVSAVRYVDLQASTVHTLVGKGLFDFGDVSNTYPRSRFQHCLGVSVWPHTADGGHDVLVADTYNHKLKLIDIGAERVRDVLGVRAAAAGPADMVFDEPGGLCYVQAHEGPRVFVADTNNHRIVVVDPQTRLWQELVVTGLDDDAPQPAPATAPEKVIAAKEATPLRLRLTPSVDADTKLNPEAPIGVRITNDGRIVAQRTIRTVAFPLIIDLPAAEVVAGARLSIEVNFGVCTLADAGVCRPDAASWLLRIEKGDASQVDLAE